MTATAPRLVYVAPVPWSSFAQRPHQYVRWWHSTTGGEVLWVNPYPARLPQWSDIHRLRQLPPAPGPACPGWLQLLQPPVWPIEALPGSAVLQRLLWRQVLARVGRFVAEGSCELVVGKPSRLALQIARAGAREGGLEGTFTHRCYDAMDDFPAFHRGRAARLMAQLEQALMPWVDVVTASSTALVTKFTVRHANVIPVLNGFDPLAMPNHSKASQPMDRPVLGYVGTIREWFDWPLVLQLAQATPQATIRLIGPLDTPPLARLPPNVEWLPACPHPMAMQHMAQFSAGLIPFELNRLTDGVDPIKYYEYAALGLPVLSTPFGEMRHRSQAEGVFHLTPGADLAANVRAALAWQPQAGQLERFHKEHGWAARFASAQPASETAQAPTSGLLQQAPVLPEHG